MMQYVFVDIKICYQVKFISKDDTVTSSYYFYTKQMKLSLHWSE
ncbi:unnamed protein product [Brugia timori]|uniref:Uncharacterized protein n=1 Tax=Brugia timori TaxID=42155 RepID=A0A3P7SUF8_9BILA|nr:unnamed protein product [Brugia timori]